MLFRSGLARLGSPLAETSLNPDGVKRQVLIHLVFVLPEVVLAWPEKLKMAGAGDQPAP